MPGWIRSDASIQSRPFFLCLCFFNPNALILISSAASAASAVKTLILSGFSSWLSSHAPFAYSLREPVQGSLFGAGCLVFAVQTPVSPTAVRVGIEACQPSQARLGLCNGKRAGCDRACTVLRQRRRDRRKREADRSRRTASWSRVPRRNRIRERSRRPLHGSRHRRPGDTLVRP